MYFLALFACGSPSITTPGPPPPMAPAHSPVGARAINATSIDLYKQVVKTAPGDNVFFSGASIELALSMAAAGAKGSTKAEMDQTLHLDAASHEALGNLGRAWNDNGSQGPIDIVLANRIWTQTGMSLDPEFERITTDAYASPITPTDFENLGSAAVPPINAWVEEQTHGHIQDLIPADAVGKATRMVLTNAIYFKASWAKPFEPSMTKVLPFHNRDGPTQPVPQMRSIESFRHFDGTGYQLAMLPYEGDTLDLIVVLPDRADSLAEVEAVLTAASLESAIQKTEPHELDLQFPKLETTWSSDLKKPLTTLGMGGAFESDADFSGMTTTEQLHLDGVFHKAFVTIDEVGTVAAGATAVYGEGAGMPPTPIAFHCNRPFFYAIRDRASSTLLFVGRQVTFSQ